MASDQNHPYAHPEPGSPAWEAVLRATYAKHAPELLPRLAELLVKHKGREKRLHDALIARYEGSPKSTIANRTLGHDQCRICLKRGHWGNECPYRPMLTKKRKREKEGEHAGGQSAAGVGRESPGERRNVRWEVFAEVKHDCVDFRWAGAH